MGGVEPWRGTERIAARVAVWAAGVEASPLAAELAEAQRWSADKERVTRARKRRGCIPATRALRVPSLHDRSLMVARTGLGSRVVGR